MTDFRLSLSWDAYQKNICNGLGLLQQRGEFVDMTIAADGHFVKVHQMIMALVSPFIKELITSAQCPHPVIFLNKGEFVDMTITADGHHVKVHQMVLSLVSPYIKELIKSAQCPHPIIFLNRVSYQTLQSILEYAYTGEVLVTQDRLGEFLEACRALHIKGLENTMKIAETTGGEIYSQDDAQQDKASTMQENNKSSTYDQFEFQDTPMEEYHLDFEDSDDDNGKAVKSTQDTVVKENTPVAKPLTLQYSVSNQGYLQVVINRYIYSLRHTRKNNERFWRCVYQQKVACPAIVATKDDKVLERTGAHNHPFHDKQILKRVRNNNLFTTLNESECAAMKKRQANKDNKGMKDALSLL